MDTEGSFSTYWHLHLGLAIFYTIIFLCLTVIQLKHFIIAAHINWNSCSNFYFNLKNICLCVFYLHGCIYTAWVLGGQKINDTRYNGNEDSFASPCSSWESNSGIWKSGKFPWQLSHLSSSQLSLAQELICPQHHCISLSFYQAHWRTIHTLADHSTTFQGSTALYTLLELFIYLPKIHE